MLEQLWRVIWLLLHALANIYETLHWLAALLRRSYDRLRHGSTAAMLRSEQEFLNRCKPDLKKLPRHLSIIIGPGERTLNEQVLCRLFRYALIMEIAFISYYDTRTHKQGHLSLEQLCVPSEFHCARLSDRRQKWTQSAPGTKAAPVNGALNGAANYNSKASSAYGTGKLGGYSNGLSKSIEIREIARHECGLLIADVCCDLFEKQRHAATKILRITGSESAEHKDRDLLVKHIGARLDQYLEQLTCPDLAIVFNSCTSTFGMLPWHTSFTEFQTFSDGGWCFDASSFARVLYKYARCEQRWGR